MIGAIIGDIAGSTYEFHSIKAKVDKSTEIWLDSIEDRLTYRKWYCGHYHTEKKNDRLQIMFNDYAALEP